MDDNEIFGDMQRGMALRILATLAGFEVMDFAAITTYPEQGLGCTEFQNYWFDTPLSELTDIARETVAAHPHDCPQGNGAKMFIAYVMELHEARNQLAAGIPAEWQAE